MQKIDLKQLKEIIPFKWRVQSSFKGNKGAVCKMVAYVDARDVQEKLDQVCGAENWQDKYYSVKDTLFCSIGIKVNGEWVWKSDAGTASKTEAKKGESSDAFKRAGVRWGINRDAYNVDILEIPGKDWNNKIYPCDENNKFLKGQALFNYCNSKAKISEMENYLIAPESDSKSDLL